MTRVLFIGDVFGRPGRRAVAWWLDTHGGAESFDLVVANGENAAGGFGLTEKIAGQLFALGIDVITGGNHTFDRREILPWLKSEPRVLRPANYPPGVPGTGLWTGRARNGARLGVLNLQGRVFMGGLDDPFRGVDALLQEVSEDVDSLIVDFHAEATSEKVAFGWYLDGRVGAVVGTHTHVQTADEGVLPGGTAYITDVGMTGALDSVIGVRIEDALARFQFGIPTRFQPARDNPVFCAVTIELDEQSGRARAITRHRELAAAMDIEETEEVDV